MSRRALRRSVVTALVVGVLLFGINSGDDLLREGPTPALGWKLLATMLVPFGVSLVSTALTLREIREERGPSGLRDRDVPERVTGGRPPA